MLTRAGGFSNDGLIRTPVKEEVVINSIDCVDKIQKKPISINN